MINIEYLEKVAANVLTRPTKQILKSIPKFFGYGANNAIGDTAVTFGYGAGMGLEAAGKKLQKVLPFGSTSARLARQVEKAGKGMQTYGAAYSAAFPQFQELQLRDLGHALYAPNYKLKRFIKKRNPAMYSDSESLAETIYKGRPVKSFKEDLRDLQTQGYRQIKHINQHNNYYTEHPANPDLAREIRNAIDNSLVK